MTKLLSETVLASHTSSTQLAVHISLTHTHFFCFTCITDLKKKKNISNYSKTKWIELNFVALYTTILKSGIIMLDTFIQRGHIKLIQSGNKEMYNIIFIFHLNVEHLNFYK